MMGEDILLDCNRGLDCRGGGAGFMGDRGEGSSDCLRGGGIGRSHDFLRGRGGEGRFEEDEEGESRE